MNTPPQIRQKLQFIIVTGTSGAGKSQALRHLEDLGFFCSDNMVPALLAPFVDLISTRFQHIAVGIDSRGGSFFDALSGSLHTLKEQGFDYKILYLDAQEPILVRRFSENRRRHPLQNQDLTLTESIQQEKEQLRTIYTQADIILDTSYIQPAELKQQLRNKLLDTDTPQQGFTLNLTSFGYRYGIPMDTDLAFDVRFLPNPYYNQQMRPFTGLDKPVQNYVLHQEVTQQFLSQTHQYLEHLLPHYQKEGKSNVNLVLGCTGGRHRSVAIVHQLSKELKAKGYHVVENHRDLRKDDKRYQVQSRQRPQDLNIVALGGGTGLSNLLRGFKNHFHDLTAIVTVTDDGGSSGRLRKDMGILPPGDIRNCLLALAEGEDLMTALLNHRFQDGKGELSGHSFGNLFLTAMAELTGDFNHAIQACSEVLAIRGRVLPVSLEHLTLQAKMQDGHTVSGESAITEYGGEIERLSLVQDHIPQPFPEVLTTIEKADAVILGPGSLYTSILPHLLFPEIVEAIQKCRGPVIYVCNVMSQAGETHHYRVRDYIEALYAHAGCRNWLDYVLVNTHQPQSDLLTRYASENAYPVRYDAVALEKAFATDKLRVVPGNFLSESNYVRHDTHKVAEEVIKLLQSWFF